MTSSIASVSLAVGNGLLDVAGFSWRWAATNFLRSPLGSSGLVLATGLTLMAGTNALYLQDTRHPAPMFSAQQGGGASQPQPIAPVVIEPETIPQRPAEEAARPQPVTETASIPSETAETRPASPSIGNPDIADMQAKLMALGFFDGTVDGYYGPKTADAIRAFEARFGLPRTGAATPQVLQAVKEAPLNASATPQSAPEPTEPAPIQVASVDSGDVGALLAEADTDASPAPQVERTADVTPVEPAIEVAAVPSAPSIPPALDQELVSDIQRGLSRLGFLQGPINGVADESTARAIRRFQIFNNFSPTGEVSHGLRQMLVNAGAYL